MKLCNYCTKDDSLCPDLWIYLTTQPTSSIITPSHTGTWACNHWYTMARPQSPSTHSTLPSATTNEFREQWGHHSKSYVATVSAGTRALKLVMVFGVSSHIPDTSLHVQAVVDIENSLGKWQLSFDSIGFINMLESQFISPLSYYQAGGSLSVGLKIWGCNRLWALGPGFH